MMLIKATRLLIPQHFCCMPPARPRSGKHLRDSARTQALCDTMVYTDRKASSRQTLCTPPATSRAPQAPCPQLRAPHRL
ncbi:hypothetical protein P692DRAFT_20537518 [Suillus brevipes Sb2]|nr:hypothetical protein P692DRAFT_20537518 [Suillus brevipes Sb2]